MLDKNITLENLKTRIQEILTTEKIEPQVTKPPSDPTRRRVYLICDKQDEPMVPPLKRYIFQKGYEVDVPVLSGEETKVRKDHEENLVWCDGALIYYGRGNELWFKSKLRDFLKAPGYGRTKPFLAKAVYLAEPSTSEKEDFETHEFLILKNGQGFNPVTLDPFLEHLDKDNAKNPN